MPGLIAGPRTAFRLDAPAQHLQPVSMDIIVQDIYSEERGGAISPKGVEAT